MIDIVYFKEEVLNWWLIIETILIQFDNTQKQIIVHLPILNLENIIMLIFLLNSLNILKISLQNVISYVINLFLLFTTIHFTNLS